MRSIILVILAVLLPAVAVQASVTNIFNDGSLTGPGTIQALIVDKGQLTGSLAMDGLAAEDTAQVFLESTNVVLRASDPIWEAKGTITFSEEVLGLIYAKNDTSTYSLLTDSDNAVGLGSGYYHTNTLHRKCEIPQATYGDVAQYAGNTATINIFTNSSMDEVRIITQGVVPAPGALLLALLGTPVIGYLRRRSSL